MTASSHRLRLSFGLGFVAFVVVGSLLLLAWLRQREREESNRLFHALAQADAEFVRRLNLPRSEKLARDLAQLLGMQIEFRGSGQSTALNDDTLIIRLDDKHDMIFIRKPVVSSLSLRDPATRNAFIAFWLVSGLVGWLLARERLKRAQSERLAMLGRVATSLAHDIKNPLASIQLHAQLMTPAGAEDAQALQMITSESEVIAGLVNQWLHLANPLPPRLVKLDVAECVTAVAQHLAAQAKHAGVVTELDLYVTQDQGTFHLPQRGKEAEMAEPSYSGSASSAPPPLPNNLNEKDRGMGTRESNPSFLCPHSPVFPAGETRSDSLLHNPAPGTLVLGGKSAPPRTAAPLWVIGDSQRLMQAFRNLIVNAIQAMPQGGKLRIAAEREANHVTLCFSDTGPGFSAAALARGTELFFTEKEGGMGVGLNIAATIVTEHGGRLEWQNAPQKGAVIRVSLPAFTD